MLFSGLSYLAVVVAAVAGFAVGSVWYGVLGKPWMAALGKTADEMKPTPGPFIIAVIANLLMAYVLAGVIGHTGVVTVWSGVMSAALIWVGFVITTMAVNHGFQGANKMLTLIDGGHWLAVLIAQGVVIGLFGL